MATISNLVIRRDKYSAVAVWLEDYQHGRHRKFRANMSDEEIKAAILGEPPVAAEKQEPQITESSELANMPDGDEETEPKRNSRSQMRKDKRKLKAEYLRELKKNGIDLSAERSFVKIEAAYQGMIGKNKKR